MRFVVFDLVPLAHQRVLFQSWFQLLIGCIHFCFFQQIRFRSCHRCENCSLLHRKHLETQISSIYDFHAIIRHPIDTFKAPFRQPQTTFISLKVAIYQFLVIHQADTLVTQAMCWVVQCTRYVARVVQAITQANFPQGRTLK